LQLYQEQASIFRSFRRTNTDVHRKLVQVVDIMQVSERLQGYQLT